MTTTPARDRRDRIAAIRQEWHGQDYDDHSYQLADAVIAADQAHAAEVRAAALDEAADDLEAIDFHPKARGNYRGIAKAFAFRLRAKAAAARPEPEAHPARHRWAVETRDPDADEWVPGRRFVYRHNAVDRLAALTENHPTWHDGTPAQRRLVRETTTYTVEQPTAARPDNTGEQVPVVHVWCPSTDPHGPHITSEDDRERRRCPGVVALPARPDNTGAQRPVSLGTPCARCGHSRNWHESGVCIWPDGTPARHPRCGCRDFTPDNTGADGHGAGA